MWNYRAFDRCIYFFLYVTQAYSEYGNPSSPSRSRTCNLPITSSDAILAELQATRGSQDHKLGLCDKHLAYCEHACITDWPKFIIHQGENITFQSAFTYRAFIYFHFSQRVQFDYTEAERRPNFNCHILPRFKVIFSLIRKCCKPLINPNGIALHSILSHEIIPVCWNAFEDD